MHFLLKIIVLPFKDGCGETILPKGWKLNKAGKNPTFEEMVLLKRTPQRILLHVMTILTKLSCALNATYCDESMPY